MLFQINFYKFTRLENPEEVARELREKCASLQMLGTILLAFEGINASLTGEESKLRLFQNYLADIHAFRDIVYKETYAATQPFKRLHVKVKPEIVTMGVPDLNPAMTTVPALPPQELKRWLGEKREFLLLDTRNDYEVRLGTFNGAVDLKLDTFRQFPERAQELAAWKDKPVVAFCTGGIRCEKAAPFLASKGFKNVYQLEGGILNYFKECGGEHFEGECFVFDNRIAVDGNLAETGAWICSGCEFPYPRHVKHCPTCP